MPSQQGCCFCTFVVPLLLEVYIQPMFSVRLWKLLFSWENEKYKFKLSATLSKGCRESKEQEKYNLENQRDYIFHLQLL